MSHHSYAMDPKLDLLLERITDVSPELIWKAWTQPEHVKVWLCPKPWQVTECEIDLRPGGVFRTAMLGPNGEGHSGKGCYLEIIENSKLVWTDALEQDYRPNVQPSGCISGYFTAFVMIEPLQGGKTKYTVLVRHSDEANCKEHADRGFEEGWGTAFDQLVEYVKTW